MTATLERPRVADYAAEESDARLQTRQEALEQAVLLLAPTFGWWRGRYQLPKDKTTVSVSNTEVDDGDITTPRSVLMDMKSPLRSDGTPWIKVFQGLESRQKGLISRYSVPFPIHGVRIIPKAAGVEFFDRLFGMTYGGLKRAKAQAFDRRDDRNYRRLADWLRRVEHKYPHAADTMPVHDEAGEQPTSVAYDLFQAANEFCDNWDSIRNQIATVRDPRVWAGVEAKVPRDGAKLRAKFYMDVVPVELAGSNRGVVVTADTLAHHQELVNDACRRKVEEAIENLVAAPRQELADAISSLHDLVARDGRVTARSFAPVYEAIRKMRLFEFAATPSLLAQLNTLEERLTQTSPANLTAVEAVQSGFSAALQSVVAEVTDATKQDEMVRQFGRRRRELAL